MTTNNDGPTGPDKPHSPADGAPTAGAPAAGSPTDEPGRSQDLLARLHRTNPTVVVFTTLALFLGVLLLPEAAGAVLIVVVAVALAWLLSRTWPVLTGSARAMRVAVIGLLLVVAYVRVAL